MLQRQKQCLSQEFDFKTTNLQTILAFLTNRNPDCEVIVEPDPTEGCVLFSATNHEARAAFFCEIDDDVLEEQALTVASLLDVIRTGWVEAISPRPIG